MQNFALIGEGNGYRSSKKIKIWSKNRFSSDFLLHTATPFKVNLALKITLEVYSCMPNLDLISENIKCKKIWRRKKNLRICTLSLCMCFRFRRYKSSLRECSHQGCKRDLSLRDRDILVFGPRRDRDVWFLPQDETETETLQSRDRDSFRDLQLNLDRAGNGSGCFGRADTAKLTNVTIDNSRITERRNSVRKGEVFVKDEAIGVFVRWY